MKKIYFAIVALTSTTLFAGTYTPPKPTSKMLTVTTSVTKTVITVTKNANGKVTTSSSTNTTKAPVVKPTVSAPIKVTPLATAIDYSTWKPETIAYCVAMFGPNWMYNPSVAFMISAMGLPAGE